MQKEKWIKEVPAPEEVAVETVLRRRVSNEKNCRGVVPNSAQRAQKNQVNKEAAESRKKRWLKSKQLKVAQVNGNTVPGGDTFGPGAATGPAVSTYLLLPHVA